MRPRLLDAFCRAGGAGMGYHRAGFDVTGIDTVNMTGVYPHKFVQGDALDYIREHGHQYDVIHASPPCQAASALTKGTNKGRVYPQLIPATREALRSIGRPYVIENVAGAPIAKHLMLCGEMFGLAVIRHRFFEFDARYPARWQAMWRTHPRHRGRVAGMRHGQWFTGPYFAVYGEGGGKGTVAEWQAAMGIDWTDDRKNLAEAIPPAYTEYLGRQLMTHLNGAGAPVA